MAAQGALYQWNLPLAPKAGDSTNKGHRDTQSKQLVTIESLNHCEAVLIFESPVRLVFAPFALTGATYWQLPIKAQEAADKIMQDKSVQNYLDQAKTAAQAASQSAAQANGFAKEVVDTKSKYTAEFDDTNTKYSKQFKATNSKYSETRGYKEQISSTA